MVGALDSSLRHRNGRRAGRHAPGPVGRRCERDHIRWPPATPGSAVASRWRSHPVGGSVGGRRGRRRPTPRHRRRRSRGPRHRRRSPYLRV